MVYVDYYHHVCAERIVISTEIFFGLSYKRK